MSNIRKNIASNILKHRKALNLSQQELADLVGVKSLTTVSSWERGANSPDIEIISKLCALFKISVDEMYGMPMSDWEDKYNPNGKLKNEAKVIEDVRTCFGEESAEIITTFHSLNEQGQQKATEYVSDLAEQDKYTK